MQRRALFVVALAVALVAPLAGCLARTSSADPSDSASSAAVVDLADALPAAVTAAASWSPDAVLVAAHASEGLPADLEDPPFLYDTRGDAAVGDGLASVWSFAFRASGESSTFFAAVDGHGALVYANDVASRGFFFDAWHGDNVPVGDGVVRSEDAAGALAAHPYSAEFVDTHPRSVFRTVLLMGDEGPLYQVSRFTATGFGLHGLVDARTGELLEVARFPDDLEPPCSGCRPPDPPRPPEPPADEHFAKDVTLNAFNPSGFMEFDLSGANFVADVSIVVDVPGSSDLDARTVTVYDPYGFEVASETGFGAVEFVLEDVRAPGWGGYYRVEVGGPNPPVLDQTVSIEATVTYGDFVGDVSTWVDGFGGYVSLRQVQDHTFEVPERTTRLLVRLQFDDVSVSSMTSDAEWAVLDPSGESVGGTSYPGGSVIVDHALPGTYSIRVYGGDLSVFGVSYHAIAERTVSYHDVHHYDVHEVSAEDSHDH